MRLHKLCLQLTPNSKREGIESMISISQRITTLSPEKKALLLRHLQAKTQQQDAVEFRRPQAYDRGHTLHIPLSFAQQRLWLLDQLHPGEMSYTIPAAFWLEGALDTKVLHMCLQQLSARHESLRTTFQHVDGEPVQVIAPPEQSMCFIVDDLSNLPVAQREAEAQHRAKQEICRPFDLQQGPLWRTYLWCLDHTSHVLLLCMHHIIADAWSFDILHQELMLSYQAGIEGKNARFARLPLQYADYAIWQRQWLQTSIMEQQRSYWRKQLAGPLPVLALPTDRPRPGRRTTHGASYPFAFPAQLGDALRQLCQQEGVTMFILLLAAFKCLLARYSGQCDIIVGTPVANRGHTEIERVFGLFVNTLAVRSDLAGDPSFLEIVRRVREAALGAIAHQDIPFEQLVDALRPERKMQEHPFFQTMFICQTSTTNQLELLPNQLVMRPLPLHTNTSKFDLTLFIWDQQTSGVLTAALEYSSELFDASTIARLAEHYLTLLQSIVAQPQQRLSQLSLLSDSEREQLLYTWNQPLGSSRLLESVSQRFEAQAKRTPEALAVLMENEHLTYHELNQRVNQFARYLHAQGVGPGVCVGVCLERSVQMVVALLAILKSGGAYVPIDPNYPRERISYMLTDAHIGMLVTQQCLGDFVAQLQFQGTCLYLDAAWPAITCSGLKNQDNTSDAEGLAYIIYTSGSTGRPKGVQIPHKGLSNMLTFMQERLGITARDIFLSVTTLSFDIAALEIFLPLVTGACLALVSREVAADGQRLAQALQDTSATYMQATPATWNLLRLANWSGASSLNMICGGEALPDDLAAYLVTHGRHLWNAYGPTETTIWSTLKEIGPHDQVTIGQPIANTQVYILDKALHPTPVGVPGELYIGGIALAHGYLHRPDLTAERFLPDPFSKVPGQRLYKTGDLALRLANSDIKHLGRLDYQVKIRGFRIELGEVEQILRSHPALQNAVLMVDDADANNIRLVAYLVRHQDAFPVSTDEVKSLLKEHLPAYMLPSAFVWLETLPMTPNGKIDRQALPAPHAQTLEIRAERLAPRNVLELQLVQIFEDLLQIQPISITDDFFESGGHSFLAIQLMARLRKQFGCDLPLSTLLEGATVERLALQLRRQNRQQVTTPLVKLQEKGPRPPFFCVHPAGGGVLCYTKLASHLGSDQPFYGLQARGRYGNETPQTSVEEMAASYLDAIHTVRPYGPYVLGGWSTGGNIAFEMALQLQRCGQQVAGLMLFDTPAVLPDKEALDDTSMLLWSINDALHHLLKTQPLQKQVFLPEASIRQLSPDEQISYYLELGRRSGVLSPDVDASYMHRSLNLYRSVIRAVQDYRPAGVYKGRVTLFRASEIPPEAQGIGPDMPESWQPYITQPLQIRHVPGMHRQLMDEPFVSELASQLSACLTDAREPVRPRGSIALQLIC